MGIISNFINAVVNILLLYLWFKEKLSHNIEIPIYEMSSTEQYARHVFSCI